MRNDQTEQADSEAVAIIEALKAALSPETVAALVPAIDAVVERLPDFSEVTCQLWWLRDLIFDYMGEEHLRRVLNDIELYPPVA